VLLEEREARWDEVDVEFGGGRFAWTFRFGLVENCFCPLVSSDCITEGRHSRMEYSSGFLNLPNREYDKTNKYSRKPLDQSLGEKFHFLTATIKTVAFW
jgi:hypothetical protein